MGSLSMSPAQCLQGTQALFDASESTVQLVGDIEASESQVILRFREELAFNVPFKPKTTLSGQLILRRGRAAHLRICCAHSLQFQLSPETAPIRINLTLCAPNS